MPLLYRGLGTDPELFPVVDMGYVTNKVRLIDGGWLSVQYLVSAPHAEQARIDPLTH
jgi:hypothetical protein